MYNTTVKSIITYGCEIWPSKQKTESMLLATEVDFWRRVARLSKLERIRNETIREMMGVQNTLVL